jgi:hypothetical protein
MLETLKNMTAFGRTTRHRKTNLARKLANAGFTMDKAKIGLGVLAAAGLAAGGIAAIRRARAHRPVPTGW